jgi:hypothetical protein
LRIGARLRGVGGGSTHCSCAAIPRLRRDFSSRNLSASRTDNVRSSQFAVVLTILLTGWSAKAQLEANDYKFNVSQYDNPAATGSVQLEAPEAAWIDTPSISSRISYGAYHKMELESECDEISDGVPDPYCFAERSYRIGFLQEAPLYTEFEAHGLYLGHTLQSFSFVKSDRWQEESVPWSIEARVDKETIIVPVNVIVEIPRTLDGDEHLIAELDYPYFMALFDDASPVEVAISLGATGQGTATELIGYGAKYFLSRGEFDDIRMGSGTSWAQPDRVFSQCGIQFRLASVTHLRTDWSFRYLTGTLHIPRVSLIGSYWDRANGTSTDVQYEGDTRSLQFGTLEPGSLGNQGAINVVVVSNFSDEAYAQAVSNSLAIEVYAGGTDNGTDPQLLAHEIGHTLLGVSDTHTEDTEVLDEERRQLMNANSFGTHISGCDTWRRGVEANVEICVPPNDCDDEPAPLPAGCVGVLNESPASPFSCERMRENAGRYAANWSQNLAPQLSLLVNGEAVGSVASLECANSATVTAEVNSLSEDRHRETYFSDWTIVGAGGTATQAPGPVELVADFTENAVNTWTLSTKVTDVQGKSVSSSITVSLGDTVPPVFVGEIPGSDYLLNHSVECSSGDVGFITVPVASDQCGAVTLTGSIELPSGEVVPVDTSNGSVAVRPGTYNVQWTATDAAGNVNERLMRVGWYPCISAGSSMLIQNGVRLQSADGQGLRVGALKDGLIRIAGQAYVGGITTPGRVEVEGGATIDGDIVAGGSISVQAGANVRGDSYEYQDVPELEPPTISGSWPATCGGSKIYYAGLPGTQYLAPGCYSELRLGSRTKLQLEPGLYRFGKVTVEPQGRLQLPGETVLDVKTEFTFRGEMRKPDESVAALDVRFRGQGQVTVEAPFSGSIVAPKRRLRLGGNHGQVFKGSFFAAHLEAISGIEIQPAPLSSFDRGTLSLRNSSDQGETGTIEPPFDGACAMSPARPKRFPSAVLLVGGGFILLRRRRQPITKVVLGAPGALR